MRNRIDEYVEKDYMKKSCFSSFLPGIAGEKGVPVWCYYVNRGQGVVSFGVQDKDHSIAEFYPAEKAYGAVVTRAFRTFIKTEDENYEAFGQDSSCDMVVGRNHMAVCEDDKNRGLFIEAAYYVLPEEKIGALVRKVTIKNTGDKKRKLSVLDGLPSIIPYGVSIDSMKNMTETAKAWMQSEMPYDNAAIYKVRASMNDTAEVNELEGATFAAAFDAEGNRLQMVVDPKKVFDHDKAFIKAVSFFNNSIEDFRKIKENHSNVLPAAFFLVEKELEAGEEMVINEIYGNTADSKDFIDFLKEAKDNTYFKNKELRAEAIVDEVTAAISCQTGNQLFDAYAKNCYMDNGLRGGFPVRLGHNKVFYLYSRKHGDLERDYNFFSVLPEYYSQGNGNFRDVAQNRRVDTFFSPFIGKENVKTFISLLQPDGYNPLLIQKQTFTIDKDKASAIVMDIEKEEKEEILKYLEKPFTPGALFMKLEKMLPDEAEDVFTSLIDFSNGGTEGAFGEGYWCDHWTYIMDLIDEYLLVYPEKKIELLTEDEYSYFAPEVMVNPLKDRYEETKKGIRQYYSIADKKLNPASKKYQDKNGTVIKDSLFSHLLLLAASKFATLDPFSFGVEMEGGKPGWYDALNGLPGIFGSSYGETLELLRLVRFLKDSLKFIEKDIKITAEAGLYMKEIKEAIRINKDEINEGDSTINFWYAINKAKETYREKVYAGITGEYSLIDRSFIEEFISDMEEVMMIRQTKALDTNKEGLVPMYFYYEVEKYRKEDGIYPEKFKLREMPDFLEGQVHALKVLEKSRKKELYNAVKDSGIYDKKLSMYKVNASLKDATNELGRCKCFTPGWLENESVFLHMEYKYLLELSRAGLYKEFYSEMKNCLVCFLDPEMYGRSTLENSSFIASSANPDESVWGKGFVARLSGSTVEFLSMWRRIMFGEEPIKLNTKGELELIFKPEMPEFLIPESKKVSARFLGNCMVTYHFEERKDYYPDEEKITKIVVNNKGDETIFRDRLTGDIVKEIRNGNISEIEVFIE